MTEHTRLETHRTRFSSMWRSFLWFLPVVLMLAGIVSLSYLTIDDDVQAGTWIISAGISIVSLFSLGSFVPLIATSIRWQYARHFCALFLSIGVLALCAITLSSYVGRTNWGAPLNYPLFLELLVDVKFVLQLASQNLFYTGVAIFSLLVIYWWLAIFFPFDATEWRSVKTRRSLLISLIITIALLIASISTIFRHLESTVLQNEIYASFLAEAKPLQRKKNLALGMENLIHPPIDKSKLNPKNIVIISVDCLRADHISHRGYYRETTPFLDSLHSVGQIASFDLTTSTCNSSFCGILSILNGASYQDLSYIKFGLHDYLKKAGYQINFYLSGVHRSWYNLRQHYGKNIDNYIEGADVEGYSSYDDLFIPEILKDLPKPNEPNFFFFHLMGPHVLGKKKEAFEIFQPTVPQNLIRRLRLNRDSPDTKKIFRNNFDNGIYQTDHVVRQIYSILAGKGYLDDAVIVIVGDHGESMGENQLNLGHGGSLRQNGILVPILFIEKETQVYQENQYATQIDIAPTIADRLGLTIPESWQGVSLLDPHPERITFHEQSGFGGDRQLLALIDKQPDSIFKYMIDLPLGNELFFNLTNDPMEASPLEIDPGRRAYYTRLLSSYKQGEMQQVDTNIFTSTSPFSMSLEDSLYKFRLRENAFAAVTKSLFETHFGSRDELSLLRFDFHKQKRVQIKYLWLVENQQKELRITIHLAQSNQNLFRRIRRRGKYSKIADIEKPVVFSEQDELKYLFKVDADLVVSVVSEEIDIDLRQKLIQGFIPELHSRLDKILIK